MKTILGITLAFALASSSVFATPNCAKKQSDFLSKPAKKITSLQASGTKIASYSCKEAPVLWVQYFFVGETPAAIVPVHGKNVLFVGTVAASGVRYVSGPYIWWIKGHKAFLEDSTSDQPNKFLYSECDQQF